MALEKLAYEKLIEEMKGRDTTNGWDVVVSYDEDKINNLLKAKQDQGSVQLPEMNVPFENPNTGDMENVIYRLKLSNPSFKIEESSGHAVLTYNLTGDYGAKRRPIPGCIEMLVTVGVARLEGTVTQDGGTSGFKPQAKALHPDSNTAKTQEPSQVVDTSGSVCHAHCGPGLETVPRTTYTSLSFTIFWVVSTHRPRDPSKKTVPSSPKSFASRWCVATRKADSRGHW